MYKQYDGYPDGQGNAIKEAFGHITLVNGLGSDDAKVANGMGCFAAQVVAHFKDGAGGIYIEAPGSRDMGEEFCYHLKSRNGVLHMEVFGGPTTFFGGSSEAGAVAPIWSGPLSEFDADAADATYAKAMDNLDDHGPKVTTAWTPAGRGIAAPRPRPIPQPAKIRSMEHGRVSERDRERQACAWPVD